ncbi:hypothetical protein ABIE51_000430 [Lysobacter sp. OAE881]
MSISGVDFVSLRSASISFRAAALFLLDLVRGEVLRLHQLLDALVGGRVDVDHRDLERLAHVRQHRGHRIATFGEFGQLRGANAFDLFDRRCRCEALVLAIDVLRAAGIAHALVKQFDRRVLRFDVDHQLRDEEGQHAQHHEQAQRRDVLRALAGQVVDGDAAWRDEVAQRAEDASVQVPERLEHFLHRVRGVADRVHHRLAAIVAVVPLQRGAAVLAMGRMDVVRRVAGAGTHVSTLSPAHDDSRFISRG